MVRLKRYPDSKTYSENEEENAKVASEKFRGEFKLYQRCFDFCMEIFDYVVISTESKPLGLESKTAVVLIVPRIMQSMQAMKLLKTRGYNYDASILERGLTEAIGLCAYLSLNEKEANRWLDGKQLKVASISLFDHVSRLLGTGEHSKDTKRVYGQLCDYVHTNIRGTLYLVKFGQKRKKVGDGIASNVDLQVVPRFDEQTMGRIAAYPMLMILMLEEIFKNELGSNKKRENKTSRLHQLFAAAKLKGTV
jgi:rhodanese-related sulfurtransferase